MSLEKYEHQWAQTPMEQSLLQYLAERLEKAEKKAVSLNDDLLVAKFNESLAKASSVPPSEVANLSARLVEQDLEILRLRRLVEERHDSI